MFMKAQELFEPPLNSKKTVITSPQSVQSERSVNQTCFYLLCHHHFPLQVFLYWTNSEIQRRMQTAKSEQGSTSLG